MYDHTVLKRTRVERGLTQDVAGAAIGAARSTMCRYEHGDRIPNARQLGALIDFLRIDPRALFPRSRP